MWCDKSKFFVGKGTRSCTCMLPCWKDLPGAKWKLPATCRLGEPALSTSYSMWHLRKMRCSARARDRTPLLGCTLIHTLFTSSVPHTWQPSPCCSCVGQTDHVRQASFASHIHSSTTKRDTH